MKNIATKSKFSEFNSKNEYFHVKTRDELFAIFDKKELNETSAFTQQINTAIKIQKKTKITYVIFQKTK